VARVLINNEPLDAVRGFVGCTVCERASRNRVIEGRRVIAPSEGVKQKGLRTGNSTASLLIEFVEFNTWKLSLSTKVKRVL